MRFTLDTNGLVYAIDADDDQSVVARELVARAVRADCVQTLQSFAECFNALVNRRLVDRSRAMAQVTELATSFRVVSATEEDLRDAMAATAAGHLAFWDAMLWATARRAGCELLLSEDGHDGRVLDGVRWVNPFLDANRPLVQEALPPVV